MVRTYQANNYKLVSPWEQAMRNAEQAEGKPITTGKRMYSDVNTTQASGDQRVHKLPPIGNNPEELYHFLGEEIGKILVRSKEKIKKISKEFVLYDPLESGMMSKSAALEILKTYRVPPNENFQKQLIELFINVDEPGKIKHKEVIEFFQNSRNAAVERIEHEKQQDATQKQSQQTFNNSYTGRYDSTPSNEPMENQHLIKAKRGEAVRQAFAERRDAGLLLEVERALLSYHSVDPVDLINQLEDSLRRSCRNDEGLVPNLHVKSVVGKLQFPINTALTLKCIERLDPFDNGKIEYVKFIEFFRRAIRASPRNIPPSRMSTSHSNYRPEAVPEKPAWENKKPLHNIQSSTRSPREKPQVYQNERHDPYEKDNYYDNKPRPKKDGHKSEQNMAEQYQESLYSVPDYKETPNLLDDDIKDTFASNLEKLRSEQNEKITTNNRTYFDDTYFNDTYFKDTNTEEKTRDFSAMPLRGEAYKRVADALQDKGKFNNGVLSNTEVRQIVNYYNLLFDTNIPLQQIDNVLEKVSTNNQVDVREIVDAFGNEIN
ncbi:uncharacterized protein LOC130657360 isoform X2 [Hydractinia symbiolongicarpus]|uniref:uncharacterized protein LOC130657360 isoform X2 n=1 Tax=Hydractinia symbiolongicarpus TaxID=13093 RepID=UPI00254C39D9|nr:uncharacterized protein LOC130657360 isoform X2 [Hydractinia symbiolongicarpus]